MLLWHKVGVHCCPISYLYCYDILTSEIVQNISGYLFRNTRTYMKIIVQNKKAFFDYEILRTMEVGVVLMGDEVKSLRAKRGSLNGSFATVKGNELFLLNCNIPVYAFSYSKDEALVTISRKLLMHRKELNKLIGEISQKGMTVIPLKIYFNAKGFVKIELGVGRHRKAQGKKELLKERDIKRETQRELKNYN